MLRDAICDECWPEKRGRLRASKETKETLMFTCSGGCQKTLPAAHFNSSILLELLREQEMWRLKCALCDPGASGHTVRERYICGRCEADKPVTDFAPAIRKLAYDRTKWRCQDCQYPKCSQCGGRPEAAINQQFDEATYLCAACARPPCAGGCGTPRPNTSKYHVRKKATWYCPHCR